MQRGISAVEILIAVAIMIIITSITFSSLFSVDDEEMLNTQALYVQTILSETRTLTLAAKNDTNYGVHFDDDQLVRFTGSSYSSSDPDNVVFDLNSRVEISVVTLADGGDDVVFDRLTGQTSQPGTITVALVKDAAQTEVITITATGVIQ